MKRTLIIILYLCFQLSDSLAGQVLPPPDIDAEQLTEFALWERDFKKQQETISVHDNNSTYLNELFYSQSPYLLQHARNPVNWKPWTSKVFAKAKKENRLIFLSIGYSTCHWCHMMEKESFVDLEVARVINRDFLSIKVDREELPHIDDYYASALEQVKGNAGWPITAIITADGLPVFIDSYLAKSKLLKLLPRVNQIWQKQPDFLLTSANNIDSLVNQKFNQLPDDSQPQEELAQLNEKLIATLDPVNGGFKGETKFPSEAMLFYILDQLNRKSSVELETAIQLQLDQMIQGGLFDHIDGGFHRYSTDPTWTVPHFEKMLYNQAQLLMVYSRAYQFFREPRYKEVVEKTSRFLVSTFYEETQGFYSAIDADYLGEEGGYYLWSENLLDKMQLNPLVAKTYKVTETGKHGVTFLLNESSEASRLKQDYREQLANLRKKQAFPHIDDKVITSWNGLTIKALTEAGVVIGNHKLVDIAEQLSQKLWQERFDKTTGALQRTGYSRERDVKTESNVLYLEDYAYLADAYISLYDLGLKQTWLDKAETLIKQAARYFLDDNMSWRNNSLTQSSLVIRKSQDTELISPTAVIINVISKLDKRRGKKLLKQKNKPMLKYAKSKFSKAPLDHMYTAFAINSYDNGTTEKTRYFANGKGRVEFHCDKFSSDICTKLSIKLSLKEGWHINSEEPLQDYLIATKLELPQEFQVDYPQSHVIKLGFQEEALSVFEGSFEIMVTRKLINKDRVFLDIPLQACSDNICLNPETLSFWM